MPVLCTIYNIQSKDYKKNQKCLFQDILAAHKRCYIIRDFPNESSTTDEAAELTPYNVNNPVYGSGIYNVLYGIA